MELETNILMMEGIFGIFPELDSRCWRSNPLENGNDGVLATRIQFKN